MAHHHTSNKCLIFSILLGLPLLSQGVAQRQPSPLNEMQHGPFVSSTLSKDPLSIRSIFVYKGIAVRVGKDEEAVMVFDTDLLRVASAWTGGFLKWYPARDGYEKWPSHDGYIHFMTAQRPGWSDDVHFSDPRPWKYGPIPKIHGAYKGMYLQNDQVVFAYTIGETEILESPRFERFQDRAIFTRTLNIDPLKVEQSLQLIQVPDGSGTILVRHKLSKNHGMMEIRSGKQMRLVGYRGPLEKAERRPQISVHRTAR
jgi:hypothetical protein